MHALCVCLPSNTSQSYEMQMVEDICTVVYGGIFPILVSFAVLTNFLNAVVLIRLQTHSAPTPSRLYLFWLAVSHCLTCGPILIGTALRDRSCMTQGWAAYIAHVEFPLYNTLNCCCIYIIVGLSVDRYFAICQSQNYSICKEFRNVPIRIFLAFVIPMVIYIPMCFDYSYSIDSTCPSDEVGMYHITEGPIHSLIAWKVWAIILQIIHRLIPAFALTYINFMLLHTLNQLRHKRNTFTRKSSFNRTRRERQLVQLLFALTTIFLLTNVPSAVLYIFYIITYDFCEYQPVHEIMRGVANSLEMGGYCCDFFLYFLMNSEYRRGLRLLYKGCLQLFNRDKDATFTHTSRIHSGSKSVPDPNSNCH